MRGALPHERFFAAAARVPERVAILGGDEEIRYGDLAERVDSLAAGLARELEPEARLGILLPKGADAIAFMLAALAAGRAFVPIDSFAPRERQAAILRLGGVEALVAPREDHATWREQPELPRLQRLFAPDERFAAGSGALPPADSARIAYVLFTSGSTGVPKGVAISHGNAAHFVNWALERFQLTAHDRIAVHAPLHFDLPVLDVYGGLAAGATVCPIDEGTVLFPSAVKRFLIERQISVMYAVPSAWAALATRGGLAPGELPLRLVLYAGEEFHVGSLRRLCALVPDARVFNLYGPVETNVVTEHEVRPADLDSSHVPIGVPLPGVEVHLRGEDSGVVREPGESGEICIAGPTLSPGYLGESGLDAPRVDLETPVGILSCFPTGDHARWNSEGELVFAGRRDGLVKVRGFRVEIGDVEAALLRHRDVSESAVYPVEQEGSVKALHAVVVPRAEAAFDVEELIAWCRSLLPAYMVPAEIRLEPRLEYTSTGKVDRRALRERLEAVAGS